MKVCILNKQKVVSLILAIVICLSLSPFFAQQGVQEFSTSYGFPNSFIIIYDYYSFDHAPTFLLSRIAFNSLQFAINIFLLWISIYLLWLIFNSLRLGIAKRQTPYTPSPQTAKTDRFDFIKGLFCFFILAVCISMLYNPYGDEIVFLMILNSIGIAPEFVIKTVTFNIFPLFPILGCVFCLSRALKYWQNYWFRFKNYNILIRLIPFYISVIVFLTLTGVLL